MLKANTFRASSYQGRYNIVCNDVPENQRLRSNAGLNLDYRL